MQLRRQAEEVKNLNRNPVFVILDNVRSALNVGAIFRSCDATLVEKLYLCGITAYPPHNKIPKTAIGATEVVPWEYAKDTVEVVKKLKEKSVTIASVEITPSSVNYTNFEFPKPVAIILGHEIHGVSEEVQELSDITLSIAMLGRANSLNVATTTGIVLYEIIRQWETSPPRLPSCEGEISRSDKVDKGEGRGEVL